MTRSIIHIGAVTALGLALAGLAATAGSAGQGGVQCSVASTAEGGMIALEGTVLSPVALDGAYRFSITTASGGGSSSVNQGGYFTAPANQPTAIGRVMVNAGASVAADLSLDVDGQRIDCR